MQLLGTKSYLSLLLVLRLRAAAGAEECNLRVTGLKVNGTDLNGNWENTGGHSVTRNGSRTFATDYEQQTPQGKGQPTNIFLQYDGDRRLWAIFAMDSSMKSRELAVCRSAKCAAAMDLSALGDQEHWELRVEEAYAPNPGVVSVGCCPHEVNKCHSCDDMECRKEYSSFSHCLVASAWSCCQPWGWIDEGACLCKETRFTCLPYSGASASDALVVA